MAIREIALFAQAAKELAEYYSSLKEAREEKRKTKDMKLAELADDLNQALVGAEVVATGLETVIEVFRISGTETGKRIISICRNELNGYLASEDVAEAPLLFPARGRPMSFFGLNYNTSEGHVAEVLYSGYLLAGASRITSMLTVKSHLDWVPFEAQDSIGASEEDCGKKEKIMTGPSGNQQVYYLRRSEIRQLVREWRDLMVKTEEQIRRLREREG